MASLEARIAQHPFCVGLSTRHLQFLAECAMEMEFAAGERIFGEGDIANRFYLIEAGKVALESPSPDGTPVPIQTIGPGDVLGWSWLFPPYLWNFDARAVEQTRAIFFYGTRLREQCEADHELGYELMKRVSMVMLKRLQATRRRLSAAHVRSA
jgi:CRP-like cAMP-binding protein